MDRKPDDRSFYYLKHAKSDFTKLEDNIKVQTLIADLLKANIDLQGVWNYQTSNNERYIRKEGYSIRYWTNNGHVKFKIGEWSKLSNEFKMTAESVLKAMLDTPEVLKLQDKSTRPLDYRINPGDELLRKWHRWYTQMKLKLWSLIGPIRLRCSACSSLFLLHLHLPHLIPLIHHI